MTKKLLLFPLMMIALCMGFVSCGNEDDDDGPVNHNIELLKGDTWNFQKASVTVLGQTIDMSFNEIISYMKEAAGTDNLFIIDEKLRFTDDEMIFVNTGDRVRYTYYNNGSFTFEGLDQLSHEGIGVTMKIKSLTENQLVFTLKLTVKGKSISEDLYYTRYVSYF